jgi:hypothetical protein
MMTLARRLLVLACLRRMMTLVEWIGSWMDRTKAVGSAEREREAQIFKNLRERARFGSVFYIIHKKYIF